MMILEMRDGLGFDAGDEGQACRGRRMNLKRGRIYNIRLCSEELRRWRFLGADPHGLEWWEDEESGRAFSEASLMYAWEVVGEAGEEDQGA